jgi:hypothetical protein
LCAHHSLGEERNEKITMMAIGNRRHQVQIACNNLAGKRLAITMDGPVP